LNDRLGPRLCKKRKIPNSGGISSSVFGLIL
jgi:hypothetical protein